MEDDELLQDDDLPTARFVSIGFMCELVSLDEVRTWLRSLKRRLTSVPDWVNDVLDERRCDRLFIWTHLQRLVTREGRSHRDDEAVSALLGRLGRFLSEASLSMERVGPVLQRLAANCLPGSRLKQQIDRRVQQLKLWSRYKNDRGLAQLEGWLSEFRE